MTLLQAAQELHSKCPGTWIKTDSAMSTILETRSAYSPMPQDGGMWWRTHHLIRQLGGLA